MWGPLRRYGRRLLATVSVGASTDGWFGGGGRLRRLLGRLYRGVQVVAFWLAIPLPFLYLPVLVNGLDTWSESVAMGSLLALHVAALSLGYPYAADRQRT